MRKENDRKSTARRGAPASGLDGDPAPAVAAKARRPRGRPFKADKSGYDGIHVIYEALKKTNGATDGTVLLDAMKGLSWVSPRGPMSIDPQTRDVVQNVYVRKVERKDGELYNVEFATFENVKDPK